MIVKAGTYLRICDTDVAITIDNAPGKVFRDADFGDIVLALQDLDLADAGVRANHLYKFMVLYDGEIVEAMLYRREFEILPEDDSK